MEVNNLLYKFKKSSIVIKIIAINVVVFLSIHLIAFFFNLLPYQLTKWLVLPDDLNSFILQPWTLFSYSFIHFGLWHLLFNMLWLNWFGAYVLNLFSAKRLLTIYLLGGFFGGLLFLISYNVLPVFTSNNVNTHLIGASGAIMAIIAFIGTYTPNTSFRFFMVTIKLWQIALFLFLFDIVRLPSSGNEGGLLAHIGGAIFGYYYAIQLAKGKDIGKWFEDALDGLANLFKPRSKKPFRKVHRTKQSSSSKKAVSKSDHQKKIDAILDKIGKSGYDSLTKAEKDFLFKAGKD